MPKRFPFAVLALALCLAHWQLVDIRWESWQHRLYEDILSFRGWPVPHAYRFLPYLLTRCLEKLIGWYAACFLYRWVFTWLAICGIFRFSRIFLNAKLSAVSVLAYCLYYPLSIWHYRGQLTDPMSHALFIWAMVFLVENRWLPLAGSLALGILAKETVIVLVPAYLLCYWKDWRTWLKTGAIGLVCVATFFAARIPLGWQISPEKINGQKESMLAWNLGIGVPFWHETSPTFQNYLQVFLFIGIWIPIVIYQWKRTDYRLKVLFSIVVPTVLASSILFSWAYESRNYIPLLPILFCISFSAFLAKKPMSES